MKHLWKVILVITGVISLWFIPTQETMLIKVPNDTSFQITIKGAVVYPKTMTFYEPITYEEILKYAGGLLNADASFRPSSYMYYQSQTIDIPFKNDVEEKTQVISKININTASFSQLMTIPYMTETRAAELIIYRREHGFFETIDALIQVKYIGTATIENLRPFITTS